MKLINYNFMYNALLTGKLGAQESSPQKVDAYLDSYYAAILSYCCGDLKLNEVCIRLQL